LGYTRGRRSLKSRTCRICGQKFKLPKRGQEVCRRCRRLKSSEVLEHLAMDRMQAVYLAILLDYIDGIEAELDEKWRRILRREL